VIRYMYSCRLVAHAELAIDTSFQACRPASSSRLLTLVSVVWDAETCRPSVV
jgi:hypothetical protein